MGKFGGRGVPRRWRAARFFACVVLAVGCWPWGVRAAAAAGEELTLLVLANRDRAAQGVAPLMWNDGLGTAAQVHSEDLAAHGGNCDLHNSCDGELWWKRVQRYYPGWTALGENVAVGVSDPVTLHDGWMASPGHRANILEPSYTEFGAGIALGDTAFGKMAFATEDFGSRGALSASAYPALPAGSISPLDGGTEPRDLQVTYYHSGGSAPRAVRALVGPNCVDLKLQDGKPAYGTYGVSRSFTGSGCVPVVFEAVRSDGTMARFPASDAILVGVGDAAAYCAERTTAVPTQDCGNGPLPTPTPGPAPTPTPDGTHLSTLHATLKPGPSNQSQGVVQIQARLPLLASFDPTSSPLSLHLSFGLSGDWSRTLPQLCGGAPCLTLNKSGTSYRAKYDSQTTLSFTRSKQSGIWTMRFTARGQTLDALAAGAVNLGLSVDGKTLSGSANGQLKQSGVLTS